MSSNRSDRNTRRAGNFGERQRDGRIESGEKGRLTSDSSSSGHVMTDYDKARMWAARGRLWRTECPEAWQGFERISASCVAEQRDLSGDMLSDLVKSKDFTNHRTGKGVTLNNTLLPYIVRVLLREHPELRPYVKLRRSFFDALFGGDRDA